MSSYVKEPIIDYVQSVEPINAVGSNVFDWNRYIDVRTSGVEMADPKVVAIDFDETISDNPGTWLQVMKCLKLGGYQVVVCTWRSPDTCPEDLKFLVNKGYKIYYTSLRCKKEYMEEQGIDVSIWIDDYPYAILHNADDYPAKPKFQ